MAKKRSDELNKTLQNLATEANSIDKNINPLKAQMVNKESQRGVMRKSNSAEETAISEDLRTFEKDAQRLQDVVDKIEEYLRSDNERKMEQIEAQLLDNVNMIKKDEAKLDALKPVIDQLKKQVDDSERQKTKIEVRNCLSYNYCRSCLFPCLIIYFSLEQYGGSQIETSR